jgi:transposase InsO family protein
MGLIMKEKKALVNVAGPRYRKANKAGKTRILNEFCDNTAYHRKYAIALLQHAGKIQLRRIGNETVKVKITAKARKKRAYKRYYDEPVEKAVLAIWAFFHFVCGKRLVPMVRDNLAILAKHRRFSHLVTAEVKVKLAKVSRSTVERMLGRERKQRKIKGTSATKRGTLLKQQIAVRTFWRWDDKQPGFCETDTVSHDGGYAQGEYLFTLSATDVCLCWSEFRALKNKARTWTEKALEDIRTGFPVPLKGIDSDNGAEFINWHLKYWCERHGITFTRGRQYHKNDNAFVEQKIGDVVRKTIGYGRFQGDLAFDALTQVYDVLNPLNNFFFPNLKCIDKKQVGQKTKRIYEKEPKTPFQRVIERGDISAELKQRLVKKKRSMNIVSLQEALDGALDNLQRFIQHAPGGVDRLMSDVTDSAHGKNLT